MLAGHAFKARSATATNGDDSMKIRLATTDDIPVLHGLIAHSVRGLMSEEYTPEQLDRALGTLLGLDTQLISDGTYFVAEVVNHGEPVVVACGGWSKRETLFGSDHRAGRNSRLLIPEREPARIRAFFVHPDWIRRGIGSRILETCEQAAVDSGFRRLEMGATLTGVPLYRARGYIELERIDVPMSGRQSLTVIRMGKTISTDR